jgi:hypothetical protein
MKTSQEDFDIGMRIKFKQVWTGLIWLRIGTKGRLHKMLGN